MMLPELPNGPFQIRLAFHKIIGKLEETIARGDGFDIDRALNLLEKVSHHPELADGFTSFDELADNEALISELLADLFPAALTLNEIKAISIPYLGFVFNLSERFKNILKDAGDAFEINIRNFNPHQFYVFNCCIILNKYYGTDLDFSKPMFYDIPTAHGYMKHYRIIYNIDFMEIIPTEKAVKLSGEDIVLLMNSYDNLALWEEKFPAGSWIVKGFAIMTLIDVTVENAVSALKTNLIGSVAAQDMKEILAGIFRSIFRMPDMLIGFTEFNHNEGKFSHMPLNQSVTSYMLGNADEKETRKALCPDSYKKIMEQHTYFSVSDVKQFIAENPDNELAKNFMAQDIQSFILAPVVKNDILLGVLELASPQADRLNSVNANKLEVVLPYITDTIDRRFSEMQNKIRAVIQTNYTTLHPSVYWRFRAEAQNYIEADAAGRDYKPGEIIFKEVYPLYGQVDIKDSSITRNLSIKNDLLSRLGELYDIVKQLHHSKPLLVPKKMVTSLKKIIAGVEAEFKADTEHAIEQHLESAIYPLLSDPDIFDKQHAELINDYFKHVGKANGKFNVNRLAYEKTIAMTNENLADIIDKRQTEAQGIITHYYERFKTDGLEHNLYAGASILQKGKFALTDLRRLRLWELMVIAEMQIAHHHLKPELPYHLGVASLILAFNTPIAIRFRMDEKHFDIDGAYNIRYEVIKKRIDKAHIKNSGERITRHGKIVIIYTGEDEEKEYAEYIGILQNAGILDTHIEYFEVEDLQGVAGLKAIRIGTLYNQTTPIKDMVYDDLYSRLTDTNKVS